MNPKLLPLLVIPLLVFRQAHSINPTLWLAGALWLLAGVALLIWLNYLRRASIPVHGAVLVAAGALSNGLVMLVNGGVMPVNGMSPEMDSGAWRSADHGGSLLLLADHMALGGMSPGDFLVAAGILFTFGLILLRGVRSLSERLRENWLL
jgi:hypothetical protein